MQKWLILDVYLRLWKMPKHGQVTNKASAARRFTYAEAEETIAKNNSGDELELILAPEFRDKESMSVWEQLEPLAMRPSLGAFS